MIIFGSPRRYVQGAGALDHIGKEIKRIGDSAVLIADIFVQELIGPSVHDRCADAGVTLTQIMFGGEVTQSEVDRMAALLGSPRPDVVIAAGGGKSIDAGKLLGGKIGAKLVTVPTAASNDAPTSHSIAVYDQSHKLVAIERLNGNPELVLVDTAIIAKAPARLLSAGIGDAIVKRFEVEQCASAKGANMFGSLSAQTAVALARACYEEVRTYAVAGLAAVARGYPDENLERVVEATVLMSGLSFESGGLSISHAMTRGLTTAPGAALSLHGCQVAYGLLVQLELERRNVEFLDDIRRFFAQVGLPLALRDLGFSGDAKDIAIIGEVTANAWLTKHFERTLTPQDIVDAIVAVECAACSNLGATTV
jgi:glycerol dehydrogenase